MKYLIIIVILLLLLFTTTYPQSSLTIGANAVLTVELNADVCANTQVVNGQLSGAGGWCGGLLPVELTSLQASAELHRVLLEWSTLTEISNFGFEIERRAILSSEWTTIGFVDGNGTSNTPHSYSFADNSASAGRFVYRLKQIDKDGTFKYSNEAEVSVDVPTETALMQNFPNPFNPSTQIEFSIPLRSHVTLKVFDVLGKEVATLVDGAKDVGTYTATWNAQMSPSGIYFYRLTAGEYSMTRKLMLLR